MLKLFNSAMITGSNSGIGLCLYNILLHNNIRTVGLTRQQLDLSNLQAVTNFDLERTDLLINCAATDIGGKIDFINHRPNNITEIACVNLLSPILLCQKALRKNKDCKIVNITSTNNRRYWPNDLIYSLTKKSLSDFGMMLQIEYGNLNYLEVQLGLTKTNFNANRYKLDSDRYKDLYADSKHLTPEYVADTIFKAISDNNIKFLEISP